MSTFLYAPTKFAILHGDFDLQAADLRVIPVTALYTPNATTHDFLDDVGAGARAAPAVALANEAFTISNGKVVFDADDVTFTAVPAGAPIIGYVVYAHTGVEATSRLVGFFDNLSNLPLTPDGRDVSITWSATSDRIFSW